MAREHAALALVEYLEEEERLEGDRLYKRRLRDNLDPFEIPEDRFIEIYRLDRELTRYLIDELRHHIICGQTSRSLSLETKVLAALNFYGQGSYQKSVGKDCHVVALSQASMSRCIAEVSATITQVLSGCWIKFPENEEITRAKETFFRKYGFPGIIGCVDGTHILIKGPSDENVRIAYYNRKGDYSINTQIVCGANAEILSINARFPGSVHDAAIWETSDVRIALMQANRRGVWLLGDSGYPLEPWLMTPVLGQNSEAISRYNSRHKSTRNCVERTIGYLKSRFRCLLKQRGLVYKHEAAGNIIYACATLHNMCVSRNLPIEEEPINDSSSSDDSDDDENIDNQHLAAGRAVRDNLIQRFFN